MFILVNCGKSQHGFAILNYCNTLLIIQDPFWVVGGNSDPPDLIDLTYCNNYFTRIN